MNVFDNVAYPLREHTQLPAPLLHSTVMMKLEAGAAGAAKLILNFPVGWRRAALARAIALSRISLFDEPLLGKIPLHGRAGEADFELNSAGRDLWWFHDAGS